MTRVLVPVILSGGAGTRLWPVSRQAAPKPFIEIRGCTLLRRTLDRAQSIDGFASGAVVTAADLNHKTLDALGDDTHRFSVLLEPQARNTAPAVAVATRWVEATHGPQAVMLVLPADHLIEDLDEFGRAVDIAASMAERGLLALFGIRPRSPESGFGYIEQGKEIVSGAFAVERFVEKPDAATARGFIDAGRFLWNSGMFCFTAETVIDAYTRHAPDILADATAALHSARTTGNALSLNDEAYARLRNISFDYAIMERAGNACVVPCDPGWSDIGTWDAIANTVAADPQGNAFEGQVSLVASERTYVRSSGRFVAAVGVHDLVIVETPDAVLVADKNAGQRVKEVVDGLRATGHAAAFEHLTTERPWGTYTVLNEGERFKIKRIEVKPGGKLSLQMHHHRSEHWIVVSGTAQVAAGERTFLVGPNESTYIPVGTRHRLENPGKLPLVMIEVQCGDYVGEDDIVRFEDQYDRPTSA